MPRMTEERLAEIRRRREYRPGVELGDVVDELLAEVEAMRGALGMDTPWPLLDVLERLASAAEHLLGDHCCDGHGHEGLLQARDAARSIQRRLRCRAIYRLGDITREAGR